MIAQGQLSGATSRRVIVVGAVVVAACIGALSCSGDGPTAPQLADVTVSIATSTLEVGQTASAVAIMRDATGARMNALGVTWLSSNPAVASVNSGGVVAAITPGSAEISATAEGVTGRAAIAVIPVPVASVDVAIASAALTVGTSAQATATTRDSGGGVLAGRTVTWSSDNAAVATVSTSGLVEAVTPGTATITATSEGRKGTVTVTVTPVPVASVRVTLDHASITAVDSAKATAAVLDASGHELSGRAVQWTSSDSAIATVSTSGTIAAVSAGTALITATSEGKSGSATLVVRPAPVASISVSLVSPALLIGQSTQAAAVLRDARGAVLTDRVVSWGAAPDGIVMVSPSGVVTATGEGTATITASSEGQSGAATLTSAPVPVKTIGVALQPSTVIAGYTAQATVTLRDSAGGELTGRAVDWSSGDANIASVARDGVVTAITPGVTTITAAREGRSGGALLTVLRVPVATVSVTLADPSITAVGSTHATATLRDTRGQELSGREVAWSSSEPTVATVSADGTITGVRIGTTIISASSEGHAGSATLTVTPAPVASVAVTLAPASVTERQASQATATLRDSRGDVVTQRSIAWKSDDDAIASITDGGTIATHSAGSARITATSEGVSGAAVLVVAPAPVASVSVTVSPATVALGDTARADVVLRDAVGVVLTGRTIGWASESPGVAEVTASGVVATRGVGTATVTATSEGRSGSAVLTVVPAPVATVDVTLASSTVTAVGTTQATAIVRDARHNTLTGRAIAWSSSDPAVATISTEGAVSALHEGTTTITATSEGRTGSAVLSVTPAPVASVEVVLSPSNVWAGQTTQATATLRDMRGAVLSGRAVAWTTSDASIATVSADGIVTSLTPGRVTITGTSEGISGSVTLLVAPAPVATVSVSLATASITAVDSTVASAVVRDPNGKVLSGRGVTWASSADSIATVSATGAITGERAGSTTITASSENVSGSAVLTVVPAPVAAVAVQLSRANILAGEGSRATATLTDARGRPLASRAVAWSSDAPTIATVSADGAITSFAPGTVTISGTSEGKKGDARLTVVPVPVAKVTLVASSTQIAAGDTVQASATVLDSAGGQLAGRPVRWSSDAPSVATVDANGVVATLLPGTVTITATSEGHGASVTLLVIPPPVASVVLTLASARVIAGQSTQATAITKSARGNVLQGRAIAWATDDPAVATVDSEGVVTGVSPGTANISASSESHSASAAVTIVPVPVAAVTVSLASTTLIEGQATRASAATLDSIGHELPGRTVTWSSDNAAVATVSSAGDVTTLTPGTAHIIAASEGITGSATLTVLPVPVARVDVTLATETIHAGLTTTATAAVFDSAGNQLLNRTVEWSSDNPNVAGVSSTGLVSAHFQGIAEIGATSGGVTGSRVLTVTPAPIASVTVSLASTVLDAGQGTSAAVVLHDSLGNVLTERAVTWSSDNAAVASVSATGVVTATGPGTVHVIATSEGESGSALLTVTSAAPSAEPVGMTALTQRSFDAVEEDGWLTTDASRQYYTIASDPTAPRSPSRVAQIRYPAGWLGGDSPGLSGRDLGNATTIYLSFWVKLSPNWVGHPTGTNKIIHLWISHINRVYLVADGSDANVLTPRIGLQRIAGSYDNGFGTIGDALDLRPNLPGQLDVEIVRGRWHHWEVVLTSNTDGLPNGTADWWLDGVHVGQYTGIPFVDATETRTWDYIGFDPTWGGRDGMLDQEQSIFMDHIYVSGRP